MTFAEAAFGLVSHGFPPTVEGILVWSTCFRHVGTFSNYLAHLSCACCAIGMHCPQACDPSIRRAKATIVKKMVAVSRWDAYCRFLGWYAAQSLLVSGHASSSRGHWSRGYWQQLTNRPPPSALQCCGWPRTFSCCASHQRRLQCDVGARTFLLQPTSSRCCSLTMKRVSCASSCAGVRTGSRAAC